MVRQMRALRQMTKSAFARLVDVPTSTISRIEAGKTDPTYSMLQRIASRAGFAFDGALRDTGDDAVIERTVAKLQQAQERERAVRDLPQAATAALVTKRPGARVFALTSSMRDFLDQLGSLGQRPLVSSLEAFARDADARRSFTPVVYVDDPAVLADVLPPQSPFAKTNVVVLPKTTNVLAHMVRQGGVDMVDREWAIADAFASPGRQPEIARELLPELVGASA